MAKKIQKDDRLYLRISATQKAEMLEYAKRNDTSLSDVVSRFFENLLAHERRSKVTKESTKNFF